MIILKEEVRMIDDNLILTNLEVNKDVEVLERLSDLLEKYGYVKKNFKEAVVKREKMFPTGLAVEENFGIAIPHADREHVNKIGIAIATLKEPVLFRQMGGEEEDKVAVSLVCMLSIDDPHKHMEILSNLMELFSDHKMLEKVKNAKGEKEIIELMSPFGI